MSYNYPRIASDPSQITMFKNDVIDGVTLIAAFSPSVVEEYKSYVLEAVNGVISFVPSGWSPEPEDPDISDETLLLSENDAIEENAIILSNKIDVDAESHEIVL